MKRFEKLIFLKKTLTAPSIKAKRSNIDWVFSFQQTLYGPWGVQNRGHDFLAERKCDVAGANLC